MITSKNVWQTVIRILFIAVCLKKLQLVHSACSNIEWECDNGQCIEDVKQCNGKVDCNDGSDEIAENCIQFHASCQKFAFRCTYGACVNGVARCNGVQDCADNSDELICAAKDDSDFQGTCNRGDMQCLTSKECIENVLICDGVANCKDGSDEALEVCINYLCNPFGFGFQCGTGACVSGNAKCNGVADCVDGSDEAWELCNTPRKRNNLIGVKPTPRPTPAPLPDPVTFKPITQPIPTPAKRLNCFLPAIPDLENLILKLHPKNQTLELGTFVEDFETVHIECKNGGTLRGDPSIFCRNGEFNHDFPTCEGFCDGKLLNRLSLRAICDYREEFRLCGEKIAANTYIQLKCAFGYSRSPNVPQYLKCLPSGNFDKEIIPCSTMKCGTIAPPIATLSKNGIETHVSKAPWHVAIFEDRHLYNLYLCGGSIISPTVVVTAAHCFWDVANQVQKHKAKYQIVAGRSTSNYSVEQTDYSQAVKVLEVHIPEEYAGSDKQQREDIAFVKLERPLKFSETITPVCLQDFEIGGTKYMPSNRNGHINGFGVHNQLEMVNMKTIGYHDCIEKGPIADDKFCVKATDGAFVCRGDSGGGFLTGRENIDTGVTIYNLWGVVSHTPSARDDCTRTGDRAYVAITNIFYAPLQFKNKLSSAKLADRELF